MVTYGFSLRRRAALVRPFRALVMNYLGWAAISSRIDAVLEIVRSGALASAPLLLVIWIGPPLWDYLSLAINLVHLEYVRA